METTHCRCFSLFINQLGVLLCHYNVSENLVATCVLSMALRPDLVAAQAVNLLAGSFRAALEQLEKVLGWSCAFRGTQEHHPCEKAAPKTLCFICPLRDIVTKISPCLVIAYKSHLPLAAGSLQGQGEHNTRVWYN